MLLIYTKNYCKPVNILLRWPILESDTRDIALPPPQTQRKLLCKIIPVLTLSTEPYLIINLSQRYLQTKDPFTMHINVRTYDPEQMESDSNGQKGKRKGVLRHPQLPSHEHKWPQCFQSQCTELAQIYVYALMLLLLKAFKDIHISEIDIV